MRNAEFNKGQVVKYLVWTFGLAYAVQFATANLYRTNLPVAQLVLAAMMFVPTLGVLLAGVVPALILAAGIAVWLVRRYK